MNEMYFLEKSKTLNGSVLEVQALGYEPDILFLTSNNDNHLPFKFTGAYWLIFIPIFVCACLLHSNYKNFIPNFPLSLNGTPSI